MSLLDKYIDNKMKRRLDTGEVTIRRQSCKCQHASRWNRKVHTYSRDRYVLGSQNSMAHTVEWK